MERLQTMTGSLNNLVMLLSTDWFERYWEAIGIKLEGPKTSLITTGLSSNRQPNHVWRGGVLADFLFFPSTVKKLVLSWKHLARSMRSRKP